LNKEYALDVVIPARNEATSLPRTLRALLLDAGTVQLSVYVSLNGQQDLEMIKILREIEPFFLMAGHNFNVLTNHNAGKAYALNVADRARDRTAPVLYLDADCVLLPRSLEGVCRALDTPAPVLVAPPMHVLSPPSSLSRSYFNVWSCLPNMVDDVVGAGCYAVNATGRRRWADFPEILPDDAFARSQFRPDERVLTDNGGFFFVAPQGINLLKAVSRWRAGNVALNASHSGGRNSNGVFGKLTWIAKNKQLWKHLPSFTLLSLLSRLTPFHFRSSTHWVPARSRLRPNFTFLKPKISVIIVTYQSKNHIAECLRSLQSVWAELTITVIDNASTDGTLDALGPFRDGIQLIVNHDNMGFSRAVNRVARTTERADYLLLLNPDVVLSPTAIDSLVALATLSPETGLYGGRMLDQSGVLDGSSCLAEPKLSSALSFAMWRFFPWYDPDSLGGWQRNDTRYVPVLTGGLLLVDRLLWHRLQGFDERFFLYGEDVDLCIRAREQCARSMFTATCNYTHKRGGSHGSKTEMAVGILKGKVTLFKKHMAVGKKQVACFLLLLGVRLRVAFQGSEVNESVNWREVWARKMEWQDGW
jgi:GT2 family glycosyltransferase